MKTIRTKGLDEIVDLIYDTKTKSSFPVRGYIITYTPTGRVRRKWSAWKLDGSYMAVGSHRNDIDI